MEEKLMYTLLHTWKAKASRRAEDGKYCIAECGKRRWDECSDLNIRTPRIPHKKGHAWIH